MDGQFTLLTGRPGLRSWQRLRRWMGEAPDGTWSLEEATRYCHCAGAAELGRVFEPYARLVGDPTMSAPGLGLGLPIVRELVAAHGGEIRFVADRLMRGFKFTLPSGQTVGTSMPRPVDLLSSR